MLRKLKKAQAVLEYVLILTALVGAFLALKNVVANKVQTSFGTAANNMENMVNKINF